MSWRFWASLAPADVAELDAQGLARFYWQSEAPVYNGSDFRAGLRGGITSQIEEEFKVQPPRAAG